MELDSKQHTVEDIQQSAQDVDTTIGCEYTA